MEAGSADDCLLGELRDLPDGSEAVLVRFLSSSNPVCRKWAAKLADLVSIPDDSALEKALLDRLVDPNVDVWCAAGSSIAKGIESHPARLTRAFEMFPQLDAESRAHFLARIASNDAVVDRGHIPFLADLALNNPASAVRQNAGGVLGDIALDDAEWGATSSPELIAVFREGLSDPLPSIRCNSATYLTWTRVTDPEIIAEIREGYENAETQEERGTLALSLLRLDPTATEALPDAIAILDNPKHPQYGPAIRRLLGEDIDSIESAIESSKPFFEWMGLSLSDLLE